MNPVKINERNRAALFAEFLQAMRLDWDLYNWLPYDEQYDVFCSFVKTLPTELFHPRNQ